MSNRRKPKNKNLNAGSSLEFKGQQSRPHLIAGVTDKNQNLALNHHSIETSFFSGPIPHPEILKEYEKILPGAAERIFSSFENQSAHRQKLELTVVTANTHSQKAGTHWSGAIVFLSITCGTYLIMNGHDAIGLSAIIGSLGGLVLIFITGKYLQLRDLKKKAQSLSQPIAAPENK
ncbi:membrane protein, PF10097 family [Leptospira phage vB_LbrZ_5399-LE1]|uniref:Membrane protein, PF10097 family n=1 Tax=Leptospira inadai serovar Lyme TaxID=293084 RepID=A0ABX4YGG7_9LEPT|nr:DUF2335 domain-containing protein [Leptospira inadai]AGS80680.1 membrane protein, PF10097 family [Leptospira phage vB_LbrZ_5399-LE1]AGS80880.1 membrane protein, PF10097 family [Leptospira phage vB_LinZ_10-LE1]PNV74346.1 hypothetical protein BES34_014265 [Leptospira inadai serovar Lyme]